MFVIWRTKNIPCPHIFEFIRSISIPASHLIHSTKLSTPNASLKPNNPNANTDEPDSKDFSNHSSTSYERKKNQNSNRKPYVGSGGGGSGGGSSGGPYRPNTNVGLNSHNTNSLSINNQPLSQPSVPNNPGISRKGPLIHHFIPESSGSTHIFTSGAGHHHTENTPLAYNHTNSTQNSTY